MRSGNNPFIGATSPNRRTPPMAKNKKCEECGERKPDVAKIPDPFAENVTGEIWMRNLCKDDARKRFEES
jgi:hypothetical protein